MYLKVGRQKSELAYVRVDRRKIMEKKSMCCQSKGRIVRRDAITCRDRYAGS